MYTNETNETNIYKYIKKKYRYIYIYKHINKCIYIYIFEKNIINIYI
jgi:hypothetical protein